MAPPLLLMHAFPLDDSMWSALKLPSRIPFDAPGFGPAAATPDLLLMDGIADAAAAELDRRGVERAVVGGMSMGGYAALAFWRRHRARVAALVLADTKAGADDDAGKARREQVAVDVLAKGAALLASEMAPKLTATAAGRAAAEPIMARQRPGAIAAASRGMGRREDSRATLATIDVPTLVIVGEKDGVTPPAEAESLAQGIRGATLVTIAGAGHLAILDAPEEFSAAISTFLASPQRF